MLYEHGNEFLPLRIILKDVVVYYSVYNDSKKMNFSVKDESYDKLSDILDHIHEKLEITFSDFKFLRNDGEEYCGVKVSNEICFKEDIKAALILKEGKVIPEEGQAIFTPNENTKYICRVLLHIQSVFFNMKDNKDDIRYYPQLLLKQCAYKRFISNTIFHSDLECLMNNLNNVSLMFQ